MLVGRLGTIVSTNWLRDCLSNNTANKLRVLDATWARLQMGVGYEKFYLNHMAAAVVRSVANETHPIPGDRVRCDTRQQHSNIFIDQTKYYIPGRRLTTVSHIVTAKKATREETGTLTVPYNAELGCKQHVVVYDSNPNALKGQGPALTYGKLLWENGSKNKVNILLGGYEDFSGHYPFLRTQKVMFTPRELDALQLYPYEVVPGTLYLSKRQMATQGYVRKELQITALINCSEEALTDILSCQVLNVPEADNETADLYQYFETCCNFIDHNHSVLVFSDLGISRSATILIAYIMYKNKYSLEVAYKHMKSCCQFIRPYRNFIFQLSKWEQMIFNGNIITNVEDPNF